MQVDENPLPWRAGLREVVQAIVEPLELKWEEEGMSDAHYVARAIAEIESRFQRPLYDTSSPARLSLALSLHRLPCALSRHLNTPCPFPSTPPKPKTAVNSLQPFLHVSALLLEGPETEVSAPVRKAVYDALARSVGHQSAAFGGGKLELAAQLAGRGMKDEDRSVRLSAGRGLVELMRLYQGLGVNTANQTDAIFRAISGMFGTLGPRFQETALITCGAIAKSVLLATADLLYKALVPLLSSLGHENPVLKGTAYMQLCAVAKHHKKSHYNLFAPYMDRIAPFLASRICKHPSALVEGCRFLSVTPHDFLSVTLAHTLPQIFADQDRQSLEAIAAATQKRCHALFLAHESKILARAFMAPKPGQTRAILGFITAVLVDAAGGERIDIDSVLKSCLVQLIAELVMYMGDEDMVVAEAINAVIKLEAIVNASNTKPQRVAAGESTSQFLKPYMLGIITQLNDVLQDKQPADVKRRVIRSLGAFMDQVGSAISNVAPQVMATLQSTLTVEELTVVTLESWDIFLRTLDVPDIGSYIGPTSASLVTYWPTFSIRARELAKHCLEYIAFDIGEDVVKADNLDEMADLSGIPDLRAITKRVAELKAVQLPAYRLQSLLKRINNDNLMVVARALEELKTFLVNEEAFVRELASGDVFDHLIGDALSALLGTVARDGDGLDSLRSLAFECMGILGALDPDRLEFGESETRMVVTSNFTDEGESATFAVHLIKDVLVGAFRSTSDTQYQTQIAYTIQELLRFCHFTPSLVTPGPSSGSVSLKVRTRWNALPKQVVEIITPLLASRYTLNVKPIAPLQYPIYPAFQTYREWISAWTSNLIMQASGAQAHAIFSVFAAVVRNRDVGVAHRLLPHLVLNVLVSGKQEHADSILVELLSVLEDQVDPASKSTADKRNLSAQTVFMLMDHLNKWVRLVRQDLNAKKTDGRRARSLHLSDAEEQLVRVDSKISSIDQKLMAQAALRCKAYARALMSFEQQVLMLQDTNGPEALSDHYERLHEIYAQLDEPDGMEGITTLILSPSLEHQIRQHESTGRWTSAQSCWEVQLQRAPDELRSHLGLLRCLKNVGHYDTLRTHVEGVLHRRPDWESELVGYQVESACMVGKWDEVGTLVATTKADASSVLVARVLLAMRSGDEPAITAALGDARRRLGAPIIAAGSRGYRRSYEAVLDLHLLHELRVIYDHVVSPSSARRTLTQLDKRLSARLESTQPSFRFREPIISIRRTALALRAAARSELKPYVGQSWLLSAKLARKAGYIQTAYSAVLQAQQLNAPFSYMESAKLTRVSGEPLRALRELDNSLSLTGGNEAVIDLTVDDSTQQRLRAKALLLRAKWMRESDRFDMKEIIKVFDKAHEHRKQWESGLFHLGQYQDESFKALSPADRVTRGEVMNLNTIKCFGEAIAHGDKYIYQTVPRLLTLWLDMGENHKDSADHKPTKKATAYLIRHTKEAPAYKWYTAFPQIVSRIGHPNPTVWSVLQGLIIRVIKEYPRQALWLFASAVHAKTLTSRRDRAHHILDKVKAQSAGKTQTWISATITMTRELLELCNLPVNDAKKSLSMSKDFPSLQKLAPSELIIPLQESLTASLPPTAALSRDHEPFPTDAPTFHRFFDDIDIMRSLAKPRKITIQGSNGQIFMFLGKPKDDLRKDARLMDFNAIINKLLKSNSESRRRQLRIRTYGIVTLNEECGFIQWVPNTIPIRPVLLKAYEARNIKPWNGKMQEVFEKIKVQPDVEAAKLFKDHILTMFQPVFHEWFLETFPEPSAWLASRLAYSRTTAVMCMVGFILGLGDRHCENMLLDTNTGDLIHVDFNCLFEKGKTLETPERVPFRLSQNIVDGLGITRVEGVFRIACEITMQLLRDNKDSLMSVLDAFIHDPLVEWEDEHRRMVSPPRKNRSDNNNVAASVDLKQLAKNALNPIEKKLKGIYRVGKENAEKEISASSLVQMLIEEAMDLGNLSKMYPGWAPWH
ncbi:hypothetical protein BDW22DRAFT_1397789 [Trametopsis cervina]|nr:hypothetical protein BDW22DRAFT_1397789 [Trametopsis cervina]